MLATMSDTSDPASPPRGDLSRLIAQDPLAFRAFVVKHQRAVFALLSRIVGRGPHVEDLAQETFLRAFRALPTFDPTGTAKVSTWLLTIATRLALDERRRKRPVAADGHDPDTTSGGGTPFQDRARAELRDAIERAARALPDDQCAALVLAEWHGLSLAEVGEVLGVPEATIKTRVFRAREKMRESLRAFSPASEARP